MDAVVLCGGANTRLPGGPKVLRTVAGQPWIFHKLENLKAQGITRATLLVGPHREAFRECLLARPGANRKNGKLAKRRGVEVELVGDDSLGTGGALLNARQTLPDAFWLTYGDALLSVPLPDPQILLRIDHTLAAMLVAEPVPWLPAPNVAVLGGRVVEYTKRTNVTALTHVDYGAIAMRRDMLAPLWNLQPDPVPCELEDLLAGPIMYRLVAAHPSTSEILHINTPEDLARTEAILNADVRGRPAAWRVPGAG